MILDTLRTYRLALGTLASMGLLQARLYTRLPDPMPTHWNAFGQIDGTLAKPWGVWILPLVFTVVVSAMTLLPALSPSQFPMAPFARIYRAVVAIVAGLGLWITFLVDAVALGLPLSVPRQTLCAVGLLLVVLGNWMGKITRNFYFGIRTPWTLADVHVWDRTHRLAGPLVMLAGLATAVLAAWQPRLGLVALLLGSGLAFGVPAAYSWWISPRTHGLPPEDFE